MKSYKQKLIEERLQSLYGNSYDSEVKRNIYFYSADLRKKVLKLTLYSLMYVALMFIAVVLIETLATVYQRSRYTAEEWYFVENCDYFDNDIKFYAEVNDEQYFIVYKGIKTYENNKYRNVYFYSLSDIKGNDIKMYVNGIEYKAAHKYGVLNVNDGQVEIILYIDGRKFNFFIYF